jgi:hypothetical protein
MPEAHAPHQLGLKGMIAKIKRELIEAADDAVEQGSQAMFRLRSVTIDVKFVLREVSDTTGGIDFRLFALKDGEQVSHEQLHSITLELQGLESVDFGLLHSKRGKNDE